MTLLRRAVMVPLVTVLMVSVLVFGPLLLAVAGLAGLAARSSRPTRTVALLPQTRLAATLPRRSVLASTTSSCSNVAV